MLRLHANTLSLVVYWRKRLNWWAHLELCHLTSCLRYETRPHYPTQLGGSVHPCKLKKQPKHGGTSTTGTKMTLISDKLWLIANNSKSFANRSKSIRRNNLGLCKHSCYNRSIYVILVSFNFVSYILVLVVRVIHALQNFLFKNQSKCC